MNNRLTKRQRLLRSGEFSQVFAQPVFRISTPQLLLLATPNEQGVARLGLVMSRKNVGDAVSRNRIKRLCREAFRMRAHDFATIDIIVLARNGFDKLDNPAITAMINNLFDKLRQKSADAMRTP